MSKYAKLTRYLRKQEKNAVTLDFADIEEIIGAGLPNSAFRHASWWANTSNPTPQSQAWRSAGYTVVSTQLGRSGFVIFRKPGTSFLERLIFGNWD